MESEQGPERPAYRGLAVYRHLSHRFSLLYPEDWSQVPAPRAAGGGTVFTPDPTDRHTSLLVQSRRLPSRVKAEDLQALHEGFLDGLRQLPGAEIEQQRAALRAQVLAGLAELQAAEIELAAVQQTLARRRERRPLQQQRVEAGVETRDTLWSLDDEITGLEKQERLLSSQLSQQRLAVALLAGEAWEQALGLLGQRSGTKL